MLNESNYDGICQGHSSLYIMIYIYIYIYIYNDDDDDAGEYNDVWVN